MESVALLQEQETTLQLKYQQETTHNTLVHPLVHHFHLQIDHPFCRCKEGLYLKAIHLVWYVRELGSVRLPAAGQERNKLFAEVNLKPLFLEGRKKRNDAHRITPFTFYNIAACSITGPRSATWREDRLIKGLTPQPISHIVC